MWGIDQIIKDVWAKFPYLKMVGVDEMYVVHLGRYCWTSTWSGLAFPFLLRYDLFNVTEQAFEARRRVGGDRPVNINIAGSYRWTDPKACVVDLGYDDAETIVTTKITVEACRIWAKHGEPRNDLLLDFAQTNFNKYMDWLFVDMTSIVFTLPLDHMGVADE